MKKIRKNNSAKRKKERKAKEERLATQVETMVNHPKECCICRAQFERTPESVKTWTVTVREERVRLTCPQCWHILQEALEAIVDGN